MQRTKSKILSILLSLVMLLSLLPTTALAAGNYPDYVRVFNENGGSTSLSDKQYLAANSDTAVQDGYDGTQTYVARYDKSSGTLFLNGYQGVATADSIFASGDLNIVVESDSSFTTSTTATGNLYGIRADSGKLNISGTGKLTVTATGSGVVYGISAKEGVTISAPLDVKVGKNSTTENGPVYGIHAQSGTISLPGNDMTVTATGGAENAYGVYNEAQTSSSAAGNGNIDISGKLTVSLSGGSNYNRGISSQGGDITLNGATVKILGSYRYGIFNINGNVVIKSTPDVELTSTTSSGEGICTYDGGDLTIENSTVKVSVDALAANLKGNVSIKDSKVELTSTYNHYEVIRTGNSSLENMINLSGGGSVTLTASGNQEYAMISGKVTLGANTICKMGHEDNNTYGGEYDKGNDITVLKFVHESAPATLKDIDIEITSPLEVAVPTAAPNATATNERTFVALGVYDDGPGGPVAATWEITTDPKPTGVSIDRTTGKLTVTNKAEAGTFTIKATSTEGSHTDIETVTITKDVSKETAIVLTAPTPATVAVPKSDTPNEIDLPTAAVYDQYGKPMTGTFSITYAIDGTTPTGVTLDTGAEKMKVKRTAQAGEVEVVAKLTTTAGTVTSDPVTYTITRETSKVTHVLVSKLFHNMPVPKVTEPGGTSSKDEQFTAEVLDQYLQEMTGQTVTWRVTDTAGNPVTGVSIDNTGKLTVTNEAPGIKVYAIATCQGVDSNNLDMTLHRETAKDTFVVICDQVGDAPETSILIPAATFTNSEAYTAKVYDQYGAETGGMVDWALNPTAVTGVELDTDTSIGNAILKVDSTAISGTTFKLKATTSTPGTSGVKELEITVQKKTNVSDKINFNDGTLPYNGNGQKYEKASISGITAGDNPKWTYTYAIKSGSTGMLDTATGLPKIVGTYTVTATYEDSSNIGSKSATLKITPREVAIPAPDTTVYTYDGTAKTYQIPASADYTVNHATQTNANETGYTVTVALTDENNTIWADGNTIVKHYTFKIMRATPTGEPAYTKITTSGKTLTDANLTKGTITPDGTIKWNDAEATVVEANKSYGWTYTPADTTNYKPLTGTIKLWNKSTSSGGYYYAPTVPDMPMLYRGCTGDAVKTLQDKLNALGYNSGSVDGIFGAKTYAAVTAFQKANSLGVDGIVGKLTWGKLYGVSPAMPVETTTVVGRPMVSYGSRGDAVRKLQELLNALGYDCGSVDGIFGSKTKAAVLAFQKANGLGVDGIVGPLTWAKLG